MAPGCKGRSDLLEQPCQSPASVPTPYQKADKFNGVICLNPKAGLGRETAAVSILLFAQEEAGARWVSQSLQNHPSSLRCGGTRPALHSALTCTLHTNHSCSRQSHVGRQLNGKASNEQGSDGGVQAKHSSTSVPQAPNVRSSSAAIPWPGAGGEGVKVSPCLSTAPCGILPPKQDVQPLPLCCFPR